MPVKKTLFQWLTQNVLTERGILQQYEAYRKTTDMEQLVPEVRARSRQPLAGQIVKAVTFIADGIIVGERFPNDHPSPGCRQLLQ